MTQIKYQIDERKPADLSAYVKVFASYSAVLNGLSPNHLLTLNYYMTPKQATAFYNNPSFPIKAVWMDCRWVIGGVETVMAEGLHAPGAFEQLKNESRV